MDDHSTAAVGTIIYQHQEHVFGDGGVGPNCRRLRAALTDIQSGQSAENFDWLTRV